MRFRVVLRSLWAGSLYEARKAASSWSRSRSERVPNSSSSWFLHCGEAAPFLPRPNLEPKSPYSSQPGGSSPDSRAKDSTQAPRPLLLPNPSGIDTRARPLAHLGPVSPRGRTLPSPSSVLGFHIPPRSSCRCPRPSPERLPQAGTKLETTRPGRSSEEMVLTSTPASDSSAPFIANPLRVLSLSSGPWVYGPGSALPATLVSEFSPVDISSALRFGPPRFLRAQYSLRGGRGSSEFSHPGGHNLLRQAAPSRSPTSP